MRFVVCLAVVSVVACGGRQESFSQAPPDDAGTSIAPEPRQMPNHPHKGVVDAGGPVGSLTCPSHSAIITYDRACLSSSDCAIAEYELDCCGSALDIGVSTRDLYRFETNTGICHTGAFPGCHCLAQPTKAEDGTTPGSIGKIVVTCEHPGESAGAGICRTRVAF